MYYIINIQMKPSSNKIRWLIFYLEKITFAVFVSSKYLVWNACVWYFRFCSAHAINYFWEPENVNQGMPT